MKTEIVIDLTFDYEKLFYELQKIAKTYTNVGLVFAVTFDFEHYCFRFKTFISDFELIEKMFKVHREVFELGISYQKGELV